MAYTTRLTPVKSSYTDDTTTIVRSVSRDQVKPIARISEAVVIVVGLRESYVVRISRRPGCLLDVSPTIGQ
jgi:hypothetical protein